MEEESGKNSYQTFDSHKKIMQHSNLPPPGEERVVKSESEKFYDRLINEAPYVETDSSSNAAIKNIEEIPWLNPSLVKQGEKFVANNFFAIILAHLGALLYGFSFKRLSTVLLRTGKSHGVKTSMLRYLSTFIHFKNWYHFSSSHSSNNLISDSNNNSSEVVNNSLNNLKELCADISKVRRLHLNALKICLKNPLPPLQSFGVTKSKNLVIEALKMDLECIQTEEIPDELLTYEPKVTMSQFDMVVTQFGLIALVIIAPITLGIANNEGIEGFLHLWAIYGKLLGIQDRFNIAFHNDPHLFRRIFINIGIRSLREIDTRILTLQNDLIEGFRNFTLIGSLKSTLLYGLCSKEAMPFDFKGENLTKLLSRRDWIYFYVFKYVLYLYYKFTFFHKALDSVSKWVIEIYVSLYLPIKGKKRKL